MIPRFTWQQQKQNMYIQAPAYEDDEDVYIMFGKESAGIPEENLIELWRDFYKNPNAATYPVIKIYLNSVAIVAYEVLRHQGFKAFQMEGQLHHYKW